jgi:alpha-L-arabinofuranosidase
VFLVLMLCLTPVAAGQEARVRVRVDRPGPRVSRHMTGVCIEDVNHEIYGGIYSQMVFGESFQEPPAASVDPRGPGNISGMWRAVRRGSAAGSHALESERPFIGAQSQRITFESGDGAIGVENQGLNRWGMSFVAGQPYEGYLWIRTDQPAEVRVAAESRDGARTLAETALRAQGREWNRYDFTLTPTEAEQAGRLSVTLARPGSVVLGHAFLQPGPWGRFRGLPVRRHVAEGLIRQGVTVMRLGGLMINAPGYRWKKMIGPRDRRPPYKGHWYPHSSNGWGIIDFLDFCEAAGFLPVVDLNMDETPQDMADFVAYVNGPSSSEWGRRRAQDGHPEPYRLKYLELGNEEAVDEAYWRRFKPLAEAIWAADPQIVIIVGDFEYRQPVTDPDRVAGAPRITSLAAHKKILDLARTRGREVWFDVHIWNHSPRDAPPRITALASFDAVLARLSPGAEYRLCVLEENATNHAVRRALAHGETVGGLMRLGDRVAIVCAANALQPDGQNDNGWDQGLLFLDSSRAWLQPPGYVTQMIARNYQPQVVEASVSGSEGDLDVTATASAEGTTIILHVANLGEKPRPSRLELQGFTAAKPTARLEELVGPLDARNTAQDPARIEPRQTAWEWRPTMKDGALRYTFPPRSFTILRFE